MIQQITKLQKALSILTGLYKNRFDSEQAMLYEKFLNDIPVDLVTASINNLVYSRTGKESEWPPSVGEIRAEAETIYRTATKTEIPTESEAWEELKNAISHYGYYGKPKFSNPLIAEAVKRLGFQDLCVMDIGKMGIARKHFMDIYSQVVNQQKERKRVNAIICKNPALQNLVNQAAEKMKLEAGKGEKNEQC